MPAARQTTTKVARVGTRRSPRHTRPSKTASSTTASSGAGSRANPASLFISPPASVAPASHSAPSRKKLLPYDYVPPRPRDAFLIFRGQVALQAKNSGVLRKGKRAQDAMSKEASERWHALSEAEQLRYQVLADEEKALHSKRFPGYVYLEKKKRVKHGLEWSAAKDDVFLIDEQGAIRYAPPSDDDVAAPRKGTRAGKKRAPTSAGSTSTSDDNTPDVEEHDQLYFPWDLNGHQGMAMDDDTMPFDPYATLVPPAPIDAGFSPKSSDHVDDVWPQQFPVGGAFVDPNQSAQVFFNLHPGPMKHGNTLWNEPVAPFQIRGLLESLFSD